MSISSEITGLEERGEREYRIFEVGSIGECEVDIPGTGSLGQVVVCVF